MQPVANLTLTHTFIGGFEETGSDAALNAADMDMTRFILGAGARVQAAVGENLYNRTSLLEARALVKFYGGDDRDEAKNSFILAPGTGGTLKSADTGAVGLGNRRRADGACQRGVRRDLCGCFRRDPERLHQRERHHRLPHQLLIGKR